MTEERLRKTAVGGFGAELAEVIPDTTSGNGDGDLTTELLEKPVWTEAMLASAGIPIIDVPFVTVGGGMGSFVTVDYLRIAGVPADQIRVLSNIGFPWQTYEYL